MAHLSLTAMKAFSVMCSVIMIVAPIIMAVHNDDLYSAGYNNNSNNNNNFINVAFV